MPAKPASRKRKKHLDLADTFGVRGAGSAWQAVFGMPLNEADLLFAVRREPVANRIVFQVAHDIWDNWFHVEQMGERPDADFDKEVQQALAELNAKAVFTQLAVYERLFGWAILALTFVDYGKDPSKPVKSPQEIREIFAYSSLQASVQASDEDKNPQSPRYGLPTHYTLRQGSEGTVKLHYSRIIHSATRLLDHPWKGMSVLEPVYDDLTVLRNIRWGLGQTIYRYGSGFPDVEVQGAKTSDLDDLEASQHFKNLQARSYFLHSDRVKLDFKGAAGRALNPEPYYVPVMESISAGSGIPMAILRGAQAGALTGSEVNEREYFKLISDAQSRYEPAVRRLVDLLVECGQIRFKWGKRRDYRIVWHGGFELNDKDKAAVEWQLAQARNLKRGWMTLDEIRAEQNLEALPDSIGNTVVELEKARQQSSSQPVEVAEDGDSGLLKRLRRLFHGFGGTQK